MDPYRARTAARFTGLVMLAFVGLAFLWMQRTLLNLGAERIDQLSSEVVRPVDGKPLTAVRLVLGPEGSVAATGDVDGDRLDEIVALRPAPDQPPGPACYSRVILLSPAQDRSFAILFDTDRSRDVPPVGGPPSFWKATELTPGAVDLETVDGTGAPLGRGLRFAWDPRTRAYSLQLVPPEAWGIGTPARPSTPEAEATGSGAKPSGGPLEDGTNAPGGTGP